MEFPEWPMFDDRERHALQRVLESREWWAGQAGSPAQRFEERFAKAHGAVGGLSTTNGTHALELALRLLEIGPGDEVIVPAMTFVATATAVLAVGATPVPVDVCIDTWNIDPDCIAAAITERTRAVMPVHFAGLICRMDEIAKIAETHNIHVIEDAAHAHGAISADKHAGSFGIAAAFSFQNFKLMTAGEGGILLINDPALLDRAERLVNCGRLRGATDYSHTVAASNFRMTAFQAEILGVQLDRLEELAEKRDRNARLLDEFLGGVGDCVVQRDASNGRHARYMYMLRCPGTKGKAELRERLVNRLGQAGIPARTIYPRLNDLPFWRSGLVEGRDCPNAQILADEGIWLHHRVLLADQPVIEQLASEVGGVLAQFQ